MRGAPNRPSGFNLQSTDFLGSHRSLSDAKGTPTGRTKMQQFDGAPPLYLQALRPTDTRLMVETKKMSPRSGKSRHFYPVESIGAERTSTLTAFSV
jgi:hypothetical protein